MDGFFRIKVQKKRSGGCFFDGVSAVGNFLVAAARLAWRASDKESKELKCLITPNTEYNRIGIINFFLNTRSSS